MDSLFGLLGYVGLAFLLIGYFMLVVDQMKVSDVSYIWLNLLGALFLFIQLYSGGVLPMLPVVIIWMVISMYGFYKHHVAMVHS